MNTRPTDEQLVDANLGFKKKQAVALFLGAALLLSVVGYVVFEQLAVNERLKRTEQLEAVADLQAGQVERWVEERHRYAESLGHDTAFAAAVDAWRSTATATQEEQRFIAERLETIKRTQYFLSVQLLDLDGTVLLHTDEAIPLLPGELAELKRAIAAGRPLFHDIHRERGRAGQPIEFELIVPLVAGTYATRRVVGALFIFVDVEDYLYPTVQSWPFATRTAESLLLRREGDDVVYLTGLRFRPGAPLNDPLPLDTAPLPAAGALGGPAGVIAGVDYRGQPVFAATRRIARTDWTLVAKMDAEEIFGNVRQLAIEIGAIAVVLVFAALSVLVIRVRAVQARAELDKLRHETKARALEMRFDYLTRFANDIILLTDDAGVIQEANEKAVSCYRTTRRELLGKPYSSIETKSLAEQDLDALLNNSNDGLIYRARHRRQDKTFFPVEVSMRSIDLAGTTHRQFIIRDISEREAMDRELRDSEARYRWIFENTTVALCEEDIRPLRAVLTGLKRDGVTDFHAYLREHPVLLARAAELIDITGANQTALKMFAAKDQDTLRRKILEEFLPHSPEVFEDQIVAIAEGRDGFVLENRYKKPDGRWVDVLISARIPPPDEGLMLVTVTDITAQKHAEQRIIGLGEMVDGSLNEIYIVDAATMRFIEANHGARTNLGFSLEELRQMTPPHIAPELAPAALETMLEPLRSGAKQKVQLTTVHRRKDGSTYPVEIHLQATEYCSEKVFVATAVDISERLKVNRELEESRIKFETIAVTANDAIIMLDSGGNISFWNKAAELIFGYAAAEVTGQTLDELIVPPLYHDAHARHFRHFAENGVGDYVGKTVRLSARRKNGQVFPVELSIARAQMSGEWVAIGIVRDITDKERIEEDLKYTARALRALVKINEAIIHARSEQQLLDETCRVIIDTAGYRLAWVGYAAADERKTVRAVAQSGYDDGYIESLDVVWAADEAHGKGPIGIVIRTGERFVARDIHNQPEFEPWRQAALAHGYASSIVLPLTIDQRTFGVLTIYAEEKNAFNTEEIDLLQRLAVDVAYGIHGQRLSIERKDYTTKLTGSLIQTIKTVALTVEKRDPYTAGHMGRVAELVAAIGRKLGLSDHQIAGLELGASIHDLGKIYVPAEILNRPGTLSEPEILMIRSHAQVGYDIIKDINFPWPIAQMVLQHHERLDGSGYPNGLKGDEIIFEAQLLAVADVVEAIGAYRPYRAALGIDAALAEIEAYKGVWFNPEIVEICGRVVREGRFRFSDPSEQVRVAGHGSRP